MSARSRFLLHVVLPIVVGACIYVGWRSTNLLVFHWLAVAGLDSFAVRPSLMLPDWVLYSFPDGCWVYAATSWLLLIWQRMASWVWVPVALAVASEFGQLLGAVSGTYAALDLIFYVSAFMLAGAVHAKAHAINDRGNCDGNPSFR